MSLESIDRGLGIKLRGVYPNVVFGPLAKALETSTETYGKVLSDGNLVSSNPSQYEILENENTNPVACVGVPDTYTGKKDPNAEDRKEKNVVKLPLIAFDRINNPFALDYSANDPMVRRGRFIIEKEFRERAFPITPQYQIDIISDKRVEVDDIWRELVMYLYINPNVDVTYGNGEDKFTETYPIKLLDTDNTTDVESFSDRGVLYRQTISLEITNAKMLFKSDTKLIETIPLRIVEIEGGKEDE